MSTFEAPGAGYWERDKEHVSGAITRYLAETIPAMFAGMADGMRRYGVPLEKFDVAVVGHRLYARARPVGAPEPRAGTPPRLPPRFLFRLLFLVHPELRHRKKRATEALRERLWRADAARWFAELAGAHRKRNIALQKIDPSLLDDSELARHLDALDRDYREGFGLHGSLMPVHAIPVGVWLKHTVEWTGVPPHRALALLQGTSPASTASVDAIDRIASALRDTPPIRWSEDGPSRLRQIREASPAASAALEAYLEEYGNRIVTGFDLSDRTTLEILDQVVDTIRVRIDAPTKPSRASPEEAARLRDRVPERERSTYDALLSDAREVFGVRDSDVGVLVTWRAGLLRCALLTAGERLRARGALHEVENVFDTSPGEVSILLAGARAPSAAELEARTRARREAESVEPPDSFGARPPSPPADYFPPAVASLTEAIMFLMSPSPEPREKESSDAIRGLGVSKGRYEGSARVVRGPIDFAKIRSGDVLVAKTTSPTYNVVLPLLGAVVTDRGGALCHAAIVAREFGIPAVIGTGDATERIPDGSRVVVDAERGEVRLLP